MWELRYRWFDYVFGRGPKPSPLADRINYFLVGANTWRSAPSIDAIAARKLRFYPDGDRLQLTKPKSEAAVATLRVDLADRSDVDRQAPGGGVLDRAIDAANGLRFTTEPLPEAVELAGRFSGRLDFTTNKRDFDVEIDLYASTPAGDHFQLAPYWTRVSYAGHPEQRRLLHPGERHSLDFVAQRLMGARVEAGSRIVAVVRIIKEPGRQINYGTGKDVSDETRADAGQPLEVRWLGGSYIDLPVARP
jgi:predicted acyl esterase